MGDLTAFILARVADDEHLANLAASVTDGIEDDWQDVVQPITVTDTLKREDWAKKYGYAYQHIYAMSPARVLAQCTALRAVVELHPTVVDSHYGDYCRTDLADVFPCSTLRALASIWSSHPDYPLKD